MLNSRKVATPIQNEKDSELKGAYENTETSQNKNKKLFLSFDDHEEILKCINSIKSIMLSKNTNPNHLFVKGTSNLFTFENPESHERCALLMLLPDECSQIIETLKAFGEVSFVDLDVNPSKAHTCLFASSVLIESEKGTAEKLNEELDVSINKFEENFDENVGNNDGYISRIDKEENAEDTIIAEKERENEKLNESPSGSGNCKELGANQALELNSELSNNSIEITEIKEKVKEGIEHLFVSSSRETEEIQIPKIKNDHESTLILGASPIKHEPSLNEENTQSEIWEIDSNSNTESSQKGSNQINEEIDPTLQNTSASTLIRKIRFSDCAEDSNELNKAFIEESNESNPEFEENLQKCFLSEEQKQEHESYETSFDINTSRESSNKITSEKNNHNTTYNQDRCLSTTTKNIVYREKRNDENSKTLRLKEDWEDYLKVLSHAQTELTYLCQFMNWNFRFVENLTKAGSKKFCCKIEVIVIINDVIKKYEGLCENAKNKKNSRHQASLICLYRLYSSINGLWEKFNQEKEKNPSLCRELNSNNVDVIEVWLNKTSTVLTKKWSLEDNSEKKFSNVEEYLSTLQNYKRELSLFVGQFNRVFMTPQWLVKPPDHMKYWEVEGYVRFELNSKIYECRFKNKGENKRDCLEKISMAILNQLFNEFPNMYAHFRKIKIQRGLT